MSEPNDGGEQWHAHQGLGRPVLVDAFVYSSPWVMPGVIGLPMAQHFRIAILLAAVLSGCAQPNGTPEQETKKDGPALTPSTTEQAVGTTTNPRSKFVQLGAIPDVKLKNAPRASEEELAQIKELIRRLADIESPDFGVSPTMSGSAFLPLDGKHTAGAFLLTDHKIESSDALRELVALGPKSMPQLLDSLDDSTPTKLKIDHSGGFGSMWLGREIWGNPANQFESKIIDRLPKSEEQYVETHAVTVGDICLVAIGQITGRSYQAVRYQPTACIVINSPTSDQKICECVRQIWTDDNARQKLFDSLLLDFSTRGVFNGSSLDGWSMGDSLQQQAAMRLLYYFPDETEQLIADRLAGLDVQQTGPSASVRATDEELDAYIKRCVKNGVRADDFIESVAWSKRPLIQSALTEIEKSTSDEDILEAIQNAR